MYSLSSWGSDVASVCLQAKSGIGEPGIQSIAARIYDNSIKALRPYVLSLMAFNIRVALLWIPDISQLRFEIPG